ncbi:Tas retrotransposon peptidase A16, partial [Ostertagia ostertagi]
MMNKFAEWQNRTNKLVHKQPYSNIEKLSILINCCKGDAARSLQMVPRTGESYEKAISQLKSQYQDPRRITIQMIQKLKSMKQCQDDHRSLRNNLSDIQAIIATLEKQWEAVNTTNMRIMILEKFSKSIQEEMAKKEFDSGSLWSMKDLLDNLSTAIRRREHVDGIREPYQNERSIFHTNTTVLSKLHCTGCGQQHRFQHCNKYPDTTQKIERLRELNACWKCFSLKHRTAFCRKQNCFYCSGPHSYIICRQRHSTKGNEVNLPENPSKVQSYSPNRQTSRNRHFTSNRRNQSSPRSSPRPLSRRPFNQSTFKHSPSPSRTPERQVRFSQSPQTRRRSGENVTIQFNNEFTAAFASSNNVRLMVVPVYLQSCKSHEKEVVLALLDSASDQSFISTSLVRRMSFKIQNESTIVVNTFGGKAEKRKSKRVVTCLYNAEGDGMEVELLTNDQLTPPLQVGSILPQDEIFIQDHFPSNEAQRLLHGVCGTVVPEILIGMDYFNAIMKLHEPVIRLPSGLFLTPTIFGPVLSGVAHKECEQSENDHVCRVVHTCTALDSSKTDMDISELWKLNAIGIEDMSSEEEINNKIVADFYSTVQIKDNKIFVRFPWKSNKNRLANNYNLALNLKEEWQTICDNAAEFEVSVPRAITCFAMNNRYELLTFVDASARSFAAATYLRTIGVNGVTRSSLLIARQRLAPINKNAKTVTIPRLELLALLIGVRLTNFALQEMHLSIKEVHIFSDSQVTLNWVQSNSRNGTFVINRCQEIRSKIQNWSDIEHKGDKDSGLKELSHTVLAIKSDIECQPLLFPREYSSLPKYKRVLSLVMKFLKFKIFNKVSTTNKEVLKKAIPELERIAADTPLATLTAADLLTAETLLIKSAQKTLTQEKLTKLSNLQLYRDENGLIRCRGRIHAKHLARETQEPILLPEAHNFTSLLVKDIHTRCGHQGVNGTLANLRLNYWLPKGRQIVKKLLKSCLVCKKWNSKPFFYPDSPPLPHSRTEPSRPFLHVGIDLAGPFQVLSSENGETKRWILLLTCMVTRAVHLEIVNSLSAIDFLNGLRRFIARRGKPVLIISDNATNFTLGCEIIARLSDRTE